MNRIGGARLAQARGIVMERHGLDARAAELFLRSLADGLGLTAAQVAKFVVAETDPCPRTLFHAARVGASQAPTASTTETFLQHLAVKGRMRKQQDAPLALGPDAAIRGRAPARP